MNKREAEKILEKEFSDYQRLDWGAAKKLIGGEHIRKVAGRSGTEYFFELYVSFVDERELDIEVEGMVIEVSGRRILPPTVKRSIYIANPAIQES